MSQEASLLIPLVSHSIVLISPLCVCGCFVSAKFSYITVSKLHTWKQISWLQWAWKSKSTRASLNGDLGPGTSSTPPVRNAYILLRLSRRFVSSCLVGAHWWPFRQSTYIRNTQEDFMVFLLKKQVDKVRCKDLCDGQMPR